MTHNCRIGLSRREILQGGIAFSVLTGLGANSASSQNNILWEEDVTVRNRSYNTLYLQQPNARATPRNAAQVAQVLQQIRTQRIPFAVQSSGHCFAGLSQTKSALIDLRFLNKIHLDPARKLLTAQAGASLAKVNRATTSHDLVLPAGYCQTVALGGHIGGGGVGILSRAYGLACDHLVAAKMVTARGAELQVTEQNHRDLLWALRGGGAGSFGIVTEYQFELQSPPPITLAEFRMTMPVKAAATWMTEWQNLVGRSGAQFGFLTYAFGAANNTITLSSRLVSIATEDATNKVVRAIANLRRDAFAPNLRKAPFQEIADRLWAPKNYPSLPIKFSSDFLARPATEEEWHGALKAVAKDATGLIYLSAEALGGAIDQPRFASAYPHRGAKYLLQYGGDVSDYTPIATRKHAIAGMRRALQNATTGGAYINYADKGQADWQNAYFGNSFDRLQQVKRAYDPKNLFNHALSIPV